MAFKRMLLLRIYDLYPTFRDGVLSASMVIFVSISEPSVSTASSEGYLLDRLIGTYQGVADFGSAMTLKSCMKKAGSLVFVI